MAFQTEAATSLLTTLTAMYREGQLAVALSLLQAALEGEKAPSEAPWQLLCLGVKLCNKLAVTVTRGKPLDYLKKAEKFLSLWRAESSKATQTKWTVITLLNFAHISQTRSKFHKALNYLMKAAKLAKAARETLQVAVLLALSSLYVELRSFYEAEMYAREAVNILQNVLQRTAPGKEKIRKISELYVRAFSLIGAAEEGLGNKYGSLSAYQKGLEIAKKHLPAEAPARAAIDTKTQRIRSNSNMRSSARASLSTSMQSHRSIGSPQRRSTLPKPPAKAKDRYYSEERLKKLHSKLTRGAFPFLSTDEYFSSTISQHMQVDQDVPHLRPLSATGARSAWEKDSEDRRKVSELRLRKHSHRQKSGDGRGRERVLSAIQRMEEEAAELAKTAHSHHSPHKANNPSTPTPKFPPQRKLHLGLFFKPANASQELIAEPQPETRPVHRRARTRDRTSRNKDEMEELLFVAEQEIAKIARTSRRLRSKHTLKSTHKPVSTLPQCDLAKSTQRLANTQQVCANPRSIRSSDSPEIEELARRMRRRNVTRKLSGPSVSFDT